MEGERESAGRRPLDRRIEKSRNVWSEMLKGVPLFPRVDKKDERVCV